jgi:citronellol/citronellal dehydrogenase
MSMCVLGMAEEFRADGIAVNALWPRTVIDTAAVAMIPSVDRTRCRKPQILADAARIIVARDARVHTGRFYIDEDVLAAEGISDLAGYAVQPGTSEFLDDLFLG